MRITLAGVLGVAFLLQGVRLWLRSGRPRDVLGMPDRMLITVPAAGFLFWLACVVLVSFPSDDSFLVSSGLLLAAVVVGVSLSCFQRPRLLLPRWRRAERRT